MSCSDSQGLWDTWGYALGKQGDTIVYSCTRNGRHCQLKEQCCVWMCFWREKKAPRWQAMLGTCAAGSRVQVRAENFNDRHVFFMFLTLKTLKNSYHGKAGSPERLSSLRLVPRAYFGQFLGRYTAVKSPKLRGNYGRKFWFWLSNLTCHGCCGLWGMNLSDLLKNRLIFPWKKGLTRKKCAEFCKII